MLATSRSPAPPGAQPDTPDKGSDLASLRVVGGLNALVALVVVLAIGLHLLDRYQQEVRHARDKASHAATEQSVSLGDQLLTIESVLGQLAVRLNEDIVLHQLGADAMHRTLNQFKSLVPGTHDLLLVRTDGAVLAASHPLARPGPLARYCPVLAQQADAIRSATMWRFMAEGVMARCPPAGATVLVHRTRLVNDDTEIWLLLEPGRFELELQRSLRTDLPASQYRVFKRLPDRLEILAEGDFSGPTDTPDHAFPFPEALSRSSLAREASGEWHMDWTDAAQGVAMAGVVRQVPGTELYIQVAYPLHATLHPMFHHYLLVWLAGGAAFLLFWSVVAWQTLQLMRRYHRALRRNEERFNRSLGYAATGVWEWEVAADVLTWSPQTSALFGLPPEQSRSDKTLLLGLLHPDDLPRVTAALEASVKSGSVFDVEFRLGRPGPACSIRSYGGVERNAEGRAVRIFGVVQDVTERAEATRNLGNAARQTQAILDNVADAIITINPHGAITSFNRAATQIFGYTTEEAVGQNVKLLMPEPYRHEHDGYMETHQRTGVNKIIGRGREMTGQHKNGSIFPIHLAVTQVMRDEEPLYIGLIRDISRQREAEAAIERLAFYDQLTDLPNRRLLLDRIQHAMAQCGRNRTAGALLMLDLDDFKTLNDTRGHEAGDELLVALSRRLREAVREGDTVCRFGGDEFVLLLENLPGHLPEAAAHAETIARKVLRVFEEPFFPFGREYRTTGSLGVTLFGADNQASADALLGQSDMAMYKAKSSGRNGYRFFDAELQVTLATRAALEADLRQAIGLGQLELHFQPQVDLQGQALGVEALLRWRHPQRGMVAPGVFIGLAEQSGLILDLGAWVMHAACTQLAAWTGDPHKSHLTMAVNVSAQQFRSPQFVREVLDTVQATGANASRLKLELTESVLADNVESLIQKMSALRVHGVQFSLDDFGTGYSSLSYLKRLPLDQLKIDQSFVRDVLTDPNDAAIVNAIVTLGRSLGLAVIAEGVETEAQRHFLQASGCLLYQGYLFSRPLDAGALQRFLAAAEPQGLM
jgi:diguanylate cyclase (GGDEF)-like protein/PAS domain S-box-containing protein